MNDAQTTVAALKQLVDEFVAERQWERYHDAKNLSMALAIEAAELMEHFQWTRNDELAELLADAERRAEIADEMADVACFLLSLSSALKVDLAAAVERKMVKNRIKYPAEEFRGHYERPRASESSEPPPAG